MSIFIEIYNSMMAFIIIVTGVILALTKVNQHPDSKPYRIAKRYMSTFLIYSGLTILFALIVGKFHNPGGRMEVMNIFSLINNFIGFILIFFSLISLYNSKHLIRSNLLPVFAPVVFFIALYYLLALFFEDNPVYTFTEFAREFPSSPLLITKGLILLSTLSGFTLVVIRYFRSRKRYKELLVDYFSDIELTRISWIDSMFVFLIGVSILAFLANVVTWDYFDLIYGIVLVGSSIYYTIEFINYQQVFMTVIPALQYAEKAEGSPLESPAAATDSTQKIRATVQRWESAPGKPFLQPGLSLNDVATATGINRRRLSEFINTEYRLNFNAWINQLRVEEVEQMLSDASCHRTLSEIAWQCGFYDLAGMCNAFKKIKGVTPSQYRNQSLGKPE